MRSFSWRGAGKVADLIESGAALTDIVDSHGRAVHEDAEEFCSLHSQAKRVLMRDAMKDARVLKRMRENENVQRRAIEGESPRPPVPLIVADGESRKRSLALMEEIADLERDIGKKKKRLAEVIREEERDEDEEGRHRVVLSDYEDAPWRIERLKSVVSIYESVCDYFVKREQPEARERIGHVEELHDRKGTLFVTLKRTADEKIAREIEADMRALWSLHDEVLVEMLDFRGEPMKT